MSIGLIRGRVVLEPHQPEWDSIAAQTIARLHLLLGDTAAGIEHIGSTSVRSICAKPIIDLVLGVTDLSALLRQNPLLEQNGFLYRGQDHPDQHLYICGSGDFITHHIHAVQHRGEAWNNYVNLRDYLNSHAEDAAAYAKLKASLAAQYADDRKTYTAQKSAFIQALLAKAAQWRQQTTA